MKILYSHYLENDEHPAARMVSFIASGLSKLGHEVKIHRSAGPSAPRAAQGASQRTHRGLVQSIKNKLWFWKALSRNRRFFPGDLEAVTAFQPDLILCRQDAYCHSMADVARKTATPMVTYADAPVAYETRTYDHGGRWHPPGLVERIEKYQLGCSKGVITVSLGAAKILKGYQLPVPIEVVPNGVTAPKGPLPDPQTRQSLRGKWGITAPRVVGFMGTFKAFHGLDLLEELIKATRDRSDSQWVLIGSGPGLERFRGADFWGAHKPLITGWISTEQVGELLELVDVAVAPHKRTKGEFYFCPLKLLDYAKAGCAILGSDQGDLPERLGGVKGGSWVATDDLDSWVSQLLRLLDDPNHAKSLGAVARAQVESHLTWDHTASHIDRFLKTIMR